MKSDPTSKKANARDEGAAAGSHGRRGEGLSNSDKGVTGGRAPKGVVRYCSMAEKTEREVVVIRGIRGINDDWKLR